MVPVWIKAESGIDIVCPLEDNKIRIVRYKYFCFGCSYPLGAFFTMEVFYGNIYVGIL